MAIDLPEVNLLLEERTPPQIAAWAAAQFGGDLVMSSSFGAESAVLLHMAIQNSPRIRVIMVDTGYLFPETYAFMESLRKRFDLNVWVYRTHQDPVKYLHDKAEAFDWRNDVDSCCGANKNEPFDRAMKELAPAAWLRGIRRDQADTRASRQIVEWSRRNNCYAISPLLPWSNRQIGLYMKEHELPYHPLVEKGYLSIGCNPLSCTRPVLPGEDPRAGRWAGKEKTECGLHVDQSLDSAKL
ncbi:MAG: phosphoadenylyl-sulfate reductase [Burkholderiales bacterium]|nr:phosphoadenylyl-sulfate reductase [Phycisphaerae bacterium]